MQLCSSAPCNKYYSSWKVSVSSLYCSSHLLPHLSEAARNRREQNKTAQVSRSLLIFLCFLAVDARLRRDSCHATFGPSWLIKNTVSQQAWCVFSLSLSTPLPSISSPNFGRTRERKEKQTSLAECGKNLPSAVLDSRVWMTALYQRNKVVFSLFICFVFSSIYFDILYFFFFHHKSPFRNLTHPLTYFTLDREAQLHVQYRMWFSRCWIQFVLLDFEETRRLSL